MSRCKGINTTSYLAGKPCKSILLTDKYKNGYCYAHQKQAPKLKPMPEQVRTEGPLESFMIPRPCKSPTELASDSESDDFTPNDQEKVLTELSVWMPNEKERVLAATQLVLDKCKQLNKEKETMGQCIEQLNKEKETMGQCIDQQSDKILYLMKVSIDAKANDAMYLKDIEETNDELIEQNERFTEEIERLKEQLKKQKPLQITKKSIDITAEIVTLKEQLADAKKQIDRMLPDYTTYQEIRRFEEISTRLMALYMADNHYELYGMMRKNPEEAIPYLGQSPEIEYNALRQKRNKHCHPAATN